MSFVVIFVNTCNLKLETGNWKLETGNLDAEITLSIIRGTAARRAFYAPRFQTSSFYHTQAPRNKPCRKLEIGN